MTTADRVREEMGRFREALPRLLSELEGRWVVFRDGEVVSVHDDEEQAYIAGMERFGPDGGQVIALVVPERVVPVSAAVLYQRAAR